MSRSIKDSEQTKKKILIAAKNEFAEKGFNGARMNSIAVKAGVNQALLHYHFENKENLYQNIFHMGLGEDIKEITTRIKKEIQSWNVSVEKELAAMIYLLVCGHIENYDNDLNRIIAREIADGQKYFHDFARTYMFPRITLFEEFLKEGIRLGIFEISNPLLFSISLVAFVSDYVHGEDVIRETKWHKELYKDKKKILYNYLIETTFKTLSPPGEAITPPELSKNEKAILDDFVNEITELYQIK